MNPYAAILYVHVIATLTLVAALCVEAIALWQLRRATSLTEANAWLTPVPGLRVAGSLSLLVLFLSGGYLTDRISEWNLAWPKAALAIVIIFGALAGISSSRMRGIRRLFVNERAAETTIVQRLHDPFLKASVSIRAGLILGAVLLMTAKPKLIESVVVVTASIVVGIAIASLTSKRETKLAGFASSRAERAGK